MNLVKSATLALVTLPLACLAQVPSLIHYQGRVWANGSEFDGTGNFKFALVDQGVDVNVPAVASPTVFNGFLVGATVSQPGTGYQTAPSVTVSGSGSGARLSATVSGGVVTGIQVLSPGSGYQQGNTIITIDPPPLNLSITTYWSNDGTSTGGSQPQKSVSLPVNMGAYSVLLGDGSLPNMLPIPVDAFRNPDVRLRVWFSDGINGYEQMTPDQRVTAVGYALMASSVSDGAITATQLANGSVTSGKLATAAVSTQHIQTGAVTSEQIANGAIDGAKLNDGAVSAEKLAVGALTNAQAREGQVVMSPEPRPDLEQQGFVRIGMTDQTKVRELEGFNTKAVQLVWTGKELLAWGRIGSDGKYYKSGYRYNPTTDSWAEISTSYAPTPVEGKHGAVWTGTEMVVSNGSYNPSSNTWRSGPSSDALVWTGSVVLTPNQQYNPTTGVLSAISTIGAPSSDRGKASVVWTGNEMIVWGGRKLSTYNDPLLNTGAKYNPTTDTWTSLQTSGAPSARYDHVAMWTGTKMIVWGGETKYTEDDRSGALYNPISNAWTGSIEGAFSDVSPGNAVWAGNSMLVFGQRSNEFPTQIHSYNPSSGTWTSMPVDKSVNYNDQYSKSVWTGTEMIVCGGNPSGVQAGVRYNPQSNQSIPINSPAPVLQAMQANLSWYRAVWTGTEVLFWNGRAGFCFNPSTEQFRNINTSGSPSIEHSFGAVSTGNEMVIWGGSFSSNYLNTGARYNPVTDTWTPMNLSGAPSGRVNHSLVWTGSEVLVWGGTSEKRYDNNSNRYDYYTNSGGLYNPATNTWRQTSRTGAPAEGFSFLRGLWIGEELVVLTKNSMYAYNPIQDKWRLVIDNLMTSGWSNPSIWSGDYILDSYSSYNLKKNIFIQSIGARSFGSLVPWVNQEIFAWGGKGISTPDNQGWVFNPNDNRWREWMPVMRQTNLEGGLQPYSHTGWPMKHRAGHQAIWTGKQVILIGGRGLDSSYDPGIAIITPKALYYYLKP